MRLLQKIAAAAFVFGTMLSAAHAEDMMTIKIGTEGAYPPFNNLTSDGQLEGFDIDIARALCDQMKAKCEFVTQDWDGIIPALQAGKFDAIIASMSITPEREKVIDFTNKYYSTPPALAVPKDSSLKGVTAQDLDGARIGAQSSTVYADYAEKHFPDATVVLYKTADEYKLDLENSRLDAAIDDVIVLTDWIKSDKGTCCKILGTLPDDPQVIGKGIGIGLRKGEDGLKNKFNEAIIAIRENGKYKEINDKYFDFDVYGAESN